MLLLGGSMTRFWHAHDTSSVQFILQLADLHYLQQDAYSPAPNKRVGVTLPLFNLFCDWLIHITSNKMPMSKKLSEKDTAKLEQEFLLLDKDGNGTITIEELGNVLYSMKKKLKVDESEIKRVLKDIDKDGDGTINIEEYFEKMKNKTTRHLIHRALLTRATVRKQFKRFDRDGKGYITEEDIKQFWEERTGSEVTIAQIVEALKDIDRDSDGNIDYEGFLMMMS